MADAPRLGPLPDAETAAAVVALRRGDQGLRPVALGAALACAGGSSFCHVHGLLVDAARAIVNRSLRRGVVIAVESAVAHLRPALLHRYAVDGGDDRGDRDSRE